MPLFLLQNAAEQSTNLTWGIIIPAIVFIISFSLTFMLYRHFSKSTSDTNE